MRRKKRRQRRQITIDGRPVTLHFAREQIGLMQVEAGDPDAAIATMRLISEDAGVTRGLRERAQTLIVALGGDITAPAPAE